MDEDETFRRLVVAVDDSPAARLFIELSSHAADLVEAREALEWALRVDPDPALPGDIKPFLIGFAAVSYCRCVLASTVRKPVTEHVDIPTDMETTHQTIKDFRNQTIAHSQSELKVTYPVGVLAAETKELVYVSALTIGITLPDSIVKDFATLISTMLDLLDDVLAPLRARLEESVRATTPGALSPVPPLAIHKLADDFQPRSKRPPYPVAQTFYWDREA